MTYKPYKVYEQVWVMRDNTPTKLIVFAVIESMNYSKRGTEFYYHLVQSTVGSGWGNNEGTRYFWDDVFKNKEDLLTSL